MDESPGWECVMDLMALASPLSMGRSLAPTMMPPGMGTSMMAPSMAGGCDRCHLSDELRELQQLEMMLLLQLLMLLLSGGMQSPFGFGNPFGFPNPFGFGNPMANAMPMAGLGGFPAPFGGGFSSTRGSTASEQPPVATGNGRIDRFINIATQQTGKPYVFGEEGPNAFDCSGLVCYALNQAGVKVPRLTAAGYQNMFRNSRVSREELKPGDLIFYWSPNSRGTPPGQASHIEIYLGDGKAMGTDNPSEGARVENVDWSRFIGGARVPQLQ